MKQLVVRLALLALLIHPALAGGSELEPDAFAAVTPGPAVPLPAPPVSSEPGSNVSFSPNLIAGLFVGSALFSLTLHLALRHHRRSVGQLELVRRKVHLMSPAERDFLAVLEPVVRHVCQISIKVRLADLFEIRPERGRQSAYHLISNQHIGFILAERETGHILCGIQLVNLSRPEPGGLKRDTRVDQLFASQQIPLFRIPCARRYDPAALRETLAGILGQAPISQGSFDCRR